MNRSSNTDLQTQGLEIPAFLNLIHIQLDDMGVDLGNLEKALLAVSRTVDDTQEPTSMDTLDVKTPLGSELNDIMARIVLHTNFVSRLRRSLEI
jgi:hypothetical protein